MDQFLLHAVVREAALRLAEHEVLRVSSLGHSRYLLRFATSGKDNLLLSVRPDLPRFHLLGATRVAEHPHDRFAAWLDGELTGAVLLALEKRPWDRVIEMRFRLPRREDGGGVGRKLMIELLGRSSNLILLGPGDVILGHCRDLRAELRTSAAVEPYRPPPGREAFAAVPVGPEALPIVRDRFGGAAEFLAQVSPMFARDLAAAGAQPGDADRRLEQILRAATTGDWSPVVYSARPLDDLREGDLPDRDVLLVSPLPLLCPPRVGAGDRERILVATSFRSASEAAANGLGLLERLRDFRDLRDHHVAIVRREIGRLKTLQGKLESELEKARGSDRLRREGEALLAGLKSARLEGANAVVPDPYDPAGPPMTVPIDPALPLHESARLLFERYKKGKRGMVTIEQRLLAVRSRLAEWAALERPAAEVGTPDDLDRLREEMARLGLVHASRPAKRAVPERPREAPARVRRYTSPDGLTILVGKSGDENDALTFRVASPSDFWLHAAGRPGAHVVVRNPKRMTMLPERSLRVAAEIAAFHSGARQESRVDVHYTQRKHVRKKKGMPSGQVLLRRFRTIQVTPRLPASTIEEV
ncbi:MAG: hypothetical protein AUG09_01305 [Acidobacteria bacterium 13_1_20CM_2_68_7]|nr:MAG: hypothetical protein AUG09_01305 [Acidobacteria bacterium 13_1_20CM_2_68_7]